MSTRKPSAYVRWLAVLGCRRALRREGWYVRRIRGRRVLCAMPRPRKPKPIGLQPHPLTSIDAAAEQAVGERTAAPEFNCLANFPF